MTRKISNDEPIKYLGNAFANVYAYPAAAELGLGDAQIRVVRYAGDENFSPYQVLRNVKSSELKRVFQAATRDENRHVTPSLSVFDHRPTNNSDGPLSRLMMLPFAVYALAGPAGALPEAIRTHQPHWPGSPPDVARLSEHFRDDGELILAPLHAFETDYAAAPVHYMLFDRRYASFSAFAKQGNQHDWTVFRTTLADVMEDEDCSVGARVIIDDLINPAGFLMVHVIAGEAVQDAQAKPWLAPQ